MNSLNILVLGSGVSGLTTAMTILQSTDHKVTVWSREKDGQFPANSSEAFALWLPQRDSTDPRVEGWSNYSLKVFKALAQIPDSGVTMTPVTVLKADSEKPWYHNEYEFARKAETDEFADEYDSAWVLDTVPVIDPSYYLPWLQLNVANEGGVFVEKEIENLTEFPDEFDLIINCTGLGSVSLASDKRLKSARLQVVTVKNEDKFARAIVDEEGHNKPAYVVPQGEYLKLGTVYEADSSDSEVDDSQTADILDRCSKLVPGLSFSEDDVVEAKVFHCPVRDQVRMEPVALPDKRTLIHNYGHHRVGYITSHGIAKEIAKLLGG